MRQVRAKVFQEKKNYGHVYGASAMRQGRAKVFQEKKNYGHVYGAGCGRWARW